MFRLQFYYGVLYLAHYYVLRYNIHVQDILWAGIQYSYVCPSVGGALYILHSTAAAAPTIVNGIIISVLIILTFLDTMIMIMPYLRLNFV